MLLSDKAQRREGRGQKKESEGKGGKGTKCSLLRKRFLITNYNLSALLEYKPTSILSKSLITLAFLVPPAGLPASLKWSRTQVGRREGDWLVP